MSAFEGYENNISNALIKAYDTMCSFKQKIKDAKEILSQFQGL